MIQSCKHYTIRFCEKYGHSNITVNRDYYGQRLASKLPVFDPKNYMFFLRVIHLVGVGGVQPPIHFHCVLHAKRGLVGPDSMQNCVRTKWKASFWREAFKITSSHLLGYFQLSSG